MPVRDDVRAVARVAGVTDVRADVAVRATPVRLIPGRAGDDVRAAVSRVGVVRNTLVFGDTARDVAVGMVVRADTDAASRVDDAGAVSRDCVFVRGAVPMGRPAVCFVDVDDDGVVVPLPRVVVGTFTVGADVPRRAARAVSVASSSPRAANTGNARHTAKSSLIPFISYAVMLANL